MTKAKKSKEEISNDEILREIQKHKDTIDGLLLKLQSIPAPEVPSLMECNKAAMAQRAAKFSEAARIKSAVEMAISRTPVKAAAKPEAK